MGLRQTCAKTTSRSAIRSSRHLEGANITAVSSKAAPVHMDSDRTIEVFIPAFWPVRIVAPRRALHRMTGLGIDLIMGIPGIHHAIDAHGRLGVVRARCLTGRATDAVEFPFRVLVDPGDRQLLSALGAGGEADLIGVLVGRPDGLAELLRVGVSDHAEDDRKGGEHGCLSRRFVRRDIASRNGQNPLSIGRIRL
jgi:hypothetical protein